MASISQLTARLIDLFGSPSTADPSKLKGNLTISSNGNVLVGQTTDDGVSKLQMSGNMAFSGSQQRIVGNMSDATTWKNNLAFQSNTANGNTFIGSLPNGTGNISQYLAWGSADPTNAAYATVGVNSTNAFVGTGATGSGTNLPLNVNVNGAARMVVATNGSVTRPYQPCFSLTQYYYNINNFSTNQQIVMGAQSTWGGVTMWKNNGSYFNISTGVFTAPVAGDYIFSASITSNGGNVSIALTKNGANVGYTPLNYAPNSSVMAWITASNTWIVPLAANDTVYCTMETVNSTTASGFGNSFCGWLL